jgi:hypothetical protein
LTPKFRFRLRTVLVVVVITVLLLVVVIQQALIGQLRRLLAAALQREAVYVQSQARLTEIIREERDHLERHN